MQRRKQLVGVGGRSERQAEAEEPPADAEEPVAAAGFLGDVRFTRPSVRTNGSFAHRP